MVAVVAILAILVAILVPSVNGYIVRSKKVAIINQSRNLLNAIETYNLTASDKVKFDDETTVREFAESDIVTKVFIDNGFIDIDRNKDLDKILEATLSQIKEINEDKDGDILDRIVLNNGSNYKDFIKLKEK
ncbi:type IV pilus assembly protein PilA [Clostridium frigidicarnis]|uniref:Type IV pilus assembly protein PilA n=1 Tax=Clostridium frigidicarnis TaxID=84698 RepID=A0A1I1B4T2_9CLOT|nr:type IV pilus assembly protein PilA [Clostridium frigidicarnis]